MRYVTSLLLFPIAFLGLVSCGGALLNLSETTSPQVIEDKSLSLAQNNSSTIDFSATGATAVTITQNPAHGTVSVSGTTATYRPTATYTGADGFKYKATINGVQSAEASVALTIASLPSGTTTYSEKYSTGAYDLNGWTTYKSSFGHTAATASTFSTSTYNGVLSPSRHFAVHGDVTSYAGDSVYSSLFGAIPLDGTGGAMKDWPWMAELIRIPQCLYDATIVVRYTVASTDIALFGILLNYDISVVNSDHQLTGYQILVNGGGGSMTLSRFNQANSHALAFMDRYPNTNFGTEANANPVSLGPYKGWNYKRNPWPAGGSVAQPATSSYIAIHYQYDPTTLNTTISYETRGVDGTDGSPGSWDVVVNLTGADSLPPGGSFGLMPANYHSNSSLNTTDFDIVEYKATCVVP